MTSVVPVPSSAVRAGGDLEQIKFLPGHSSIQTTERYLGSEQEIVVAVNDNLGL
jgi:site-specific recombinase XerD